MLATVGGDKVIQELLGEQPSDAQVAALAPENFKLQMSDDKMSRRHVRFFRAYGEMTTEQHCLLADELMQRRKCTQAGYEKMYSHVASAQNFGEELLNGIKNSDASEALLVGLMRSIAEGLIPRSLLRVDREVTPSATLHEWHVVNISISHIMSQFLCTISMFH